MISKSQLQYPSISSSVTDLGENRFRLTVSPLMHGYAYTLGNSLRRVLLSSVPGSAVTKIKINDLTHEYQPIDGVVEDALDVVLNLKNLRAKLSSDEETARILLSRSTAGEIRAKDFNTEGKAEISNPELYICTLSKDIDLDIEVEISKGVGYLPVEKIDFAGNSDPHAMLVDAIFTPISNVKINVEQVRVGEKTDYDKLDLEFTTDGTVHGEEVSRFALEVLSDLFQQINSALEVKSE